MYRSQGLLLFMALFSFSAAEDASLVGGDINLTSLSQKLWELMKNGIPGLVAPFSPLHQERIEFETPDINCTLTKVTLKDMDRCHVEKLTLNPNDYTYFFVVYCPHLDLTGIYSVNGTLDSQPIDNKGRFHTMLENYTVTIIGQDIKYVDKRDKMERVYVGNFSIVNETIANASVICKSLQNKDQGQADLLVPYAKTMWLMPTQPDPIMPPFWAMYMQELDNILKHFPFPSLLHLSPEELRILFKKPQAAVGLVSTKTDIASGLTRTF